MSTLLKKLVITGLSMIFLPSWAWAQSCYSTIPSTTSHLIDNNSGMVSDPKTGLIWKKCSEGQSWNSGTNHCNGGVEYYPWQVALQRAQVVNSQSTGESFGKSDWRVPNIKELGSIVELNCYDPAVNLAIFPATPSSLYLTSSPYTNVSYGLWTTSFKSGDSLLGSKYGTGHLRLVRNLESPVDMSWTEMNQSTVERLYASWGSSGSDVFAVGANGVIVHYNGISWGAMNSPTEQDLYGMWGSSASNVFAVGYGGTILHYDGTSWTTMESGADGWLFGVWGSSANDVFTMGDSGTTLHYK